MADPPSMDICPVCLKEFGDLRIGKLPCSHIFCFPCIEEWSKVFLIIKSPPFTFYPQSMLVLVRACIRLEYLWLRTLYPLCTA